MTVSVPVDALERVNGRLSEPLVKSLSDGTRGMFVIGDIRALANFADTFNAKPLPNMGMSYLVGDEAVIHMYDETIERVDVVKVNGSTFLPELETAQDAPAFDATAEYRRMLAECAVRFREYVQNHADKLEPFGQTDDEVDKIRAKMKRNAEIAERIEALLSGLDEPAPRDDDELRFQRFVERVAAFTDDELPKVDARQFRHIAQVVIEGASPEYPDFSKMTESKWPNPANISVSGGVVWGDGIEIVDGRPSWMGDGRLSDTAPRMMMRRKSDRSWGEWSRHGFNWNDFDLYRLPDDHPYYLAASKGFEYWPGGDEAPSDWDGGKTLFRCGVECPLGQAYRWNHDGEGVREKDIIGYRKRATISTKPSTIGGGATVEPLKEMDVSTLETTVTGMPGEVSDRFSQRQRAEKIDRFAAAALQGLLANDADTTVVYAEAVTGEKMPQGDYAANCAWWARFNSAVAYENAFAMMAEREKRGLS